MDVWHTLLLHWCTTPKRTLSGDSEAPGSFLVRRFREPTSVTSHKPDCISPRAGLPKRDRVFRECAWGPPSSGRVGIEIVMIQKAEEVSDQGADATKASRADDLGGDFAKEA